VKLFLTHLHSDHTVGIPDLWLTGWLPTLHIKDLSSKPFVVAGPQGTTSLMEHLREAYAADIAMRYTQDHLTAPQFDARDIEPGIVYDTDGVKVTAFDVEHGAHAKPAFGYRVDYQNRSVVVSGDTKYSENVLKYATGVDVLIHEVAMARPASIARDPILSKAILAVHTSPQEAGRLFSAAKPRLAVFTHFAIAGQTGADAASPAEFEAAARETYDGPLELGEDLLTIRVGESIQIERPSKH
jgi:ribonuclease Z